MQARFYRQLLERGLTPDDLVRNYGVTISQIQDWVRADVVYRLACSLDFPEGVRAKVQNSREFPLSTLERLVESQAIREFLMLRPDPKEVLVSAAKPEAFLRAFRRVVKDVAIGKVDSRVANSAANITSYVGSIEAVRPVERSGDKFSVRKHLSETDRPSPTLTVKAAPPRKMPASASAIPRGLRCFCPDTRVEDVFDELRKLRLDRNPNASAVLLRVLLELSVSFYLDSTGGIKPLLERAQRKQGRARDWYPSLRQLMEHLLSMDIGLQPLELKGLRRFVQTKGEGTTLDALDGFVHNRRLLPTDKEVRAIVKLIEPVLRVTLARAPADLR